MGSKKTCSNAIDNKSSINSCPPSSCKEIIRTDDLWPSSYRQIIRVKASRFVHLFFGSIRLRSLKKRSQKKREVSIPILKVQKYFQFHDKPTSNLFNLWGFDTFIRVSCQQLDFVIRGSWLLYSFHFIHRVITKAMKYWCIIQSVFCVTNCFFYVLLSISSYYYCSAQ